MNDELKKLCFFFVRAPSMSKGILAVSLIDCCQKTENNEVTVNVFFLVSLLLFIKLFTCFFW